MTGTDVEVFGQCGARDVLAGYPGFEAVDMGQPRVFSQDFRVATGDDEVSLTQRKMLFQNVICWLHHCECSTFDVVLQAEASKEELNLGEQLTYTISISHNGECEATGAVVTDLLPAGMIFEKAESQQGSCTYDPGHHALICNLGHLAKSSTTPITIMARASLGGTWTNLVSVRINGERNTENDSAEMVTVVQGSAVRLGMRVAAPGVPVLRLDGQSGQHYTIESSPDLRQWTPWRANISGPAWSESLSLDSSPQFYRARGP